MTRPRADASTLWRTSAAQVGINLVGITLAIALRSSLPREPLLALQLAAFGSSVTLGAFVLLRRRSWTIRDARVSFFVAIAVLFPMLWAAEAANLHAGRPWAAFEGHRLSVLTVALITPAERAVGTIGIAAFALLAIAQYLSWDGAERALAVGPEPWPTVTYAVFALLLLDHRVRQLRAVRDAEVARADAKLVERFGRLSLAVRDRIGSSLQALRLDAELVRRRAPQLTDLTDRIGIALDRLVSLTELLDRQARTVQWSRGAESFDADRELARHDASLASSEEVTPIPR